MNYAIPMEHIPILLSFSCPLFDLSFKSYSMCILSVVLPFPLSLCRAFSLSGLARVLDFLKTQGCIYPTLTVLHICFDQAIFYEVERLVFSFHLIPLFLSIQRAAQHRGIVTLWVSQEHMHTVRTRSVRRSRKYKESELQCSVIAVQQRSRCCSS